MSEQGVVPVVHLWEQRHPYYCEQGNFFKTGLHHKFASWDEFVTDGIGGNSDMTANLLVRWDWQEWPADTEYDTSGATPPRALPPRTLLYCVWLIQRKSFTMTSEVPVTRGMEDMVRAWLAPRAEVLADTWAPLLRVV